MKIKFSTKTEGPAMAAEKNTGTMEPTCLDKLMDVLDQIAYDTAPAPVTAKAKECLADFFGIFCEGTRKQEAKDLRTALGGGSIVNDAEDMAFWMGSTARMLDIDDGHRFAMAHPGVAINSTAIAMAAALPDVSGKILLEGVIKAYEVYCYQGRVINPSAYLKRGVDATCICGSGAAAAAAGTMLGLSRAQMADAISLSASLAGGLNQSAIDGSAQKFLVAGWGAKLGIAAANLAKYGMGGPCRVFEGRLGFCNAFAPDPDLAYLDYPTLCWDILNVYIKMYACVRRIHATLDAVKAIVEREGLKADAVQRVKVFGSQFLYDAGGYRPKDMAQAQTSVPYAVALFLKYGEVSDDLVHENLRNEAIMAFSERVSVEKDAEIIKLTEKDKSLWGAARVELYTTDGRMFTETKITPDGDPETPLPEGTVRRKFLAHTQNTLGAAGGGALWDSIQALDGEAKAGTAFLQTIAKL